MAGIFRQYPFNALILDIMVSMSKTLVESDMAMYTDTRFISGRYNKRTRVWVQTIRLVDLSVRSDLIR